MKPSPPPIVTLTTDFGTADPYVAEMKGRLARDCPRARIIDVSHDVPPFGIETAAYVLERAAATFPDGTVHVAVVDPGVGGTRRALVVASGGQWFIGPDNGVFDAFFDAATVRELVPEQVTATAISKTFHGRDLFVPAAARLACGEPADGFSRPAADAVRLDPRRPARVVHVDRFGNAVTSVGVADLRGRPAVEVAGRRIDTWVETYAEAPPGHPVLLLGSSGRLEVALREDSVARQLGLEPGTPIHLVQDKESS